MPINDTVMGRISQSDVFILSQTFVATTTFNDEVASLWVLDELYDGVFPRLAMWASSVPSVYEITELLSLIHI